MINILTKGDQQLLIKHLGFNLNVFHCREDPSSKNCVRFKLEYSSTDSILPLLKKLCVLSSLLCCAGSSGNL